MAPDFQLDLRLVRRRAGRAAATYAEVDALAREVARRMGERLDYIRIAPSRILDLGCGPGADLPAFAARYPDVPRLAVDVARPMLALARDAHGPQQGFFQRLLGSRGTPSAPGFLCADARALPLKRGAVSLVWSNLMLQWLHDPLPALKEMHRVLEVGGMLMFSTLGPDTLRELRSVLPGPDGARLHRFIDMHDLGDELAKAGFADPVMDMERLTLTWASPQAMLAELRTWGGNVAVGRFEGLRTPRWRERLQEVLAEQLARPDGRLGMTVEVIYGHAIKPPPRPKVAAETAVSLEDMRAMMKRNPGERP